MTLDLYRKKRNFKRTPEPKGKHSTKDRYRFVVHEHHASRLHYDFRLEIGGVLKSWAIPKGPSLDPQQRRLAVMVEDHPIEYVDFVGHIAEGNYGAGDVVIWDSGTFELFEIQDPIKSLEEGKLSFQLRGKKLLGQFTLIQMKDKKQWLLIKNKDEFAISGWETEPALKPDQTEQSGAEESKRGQSKRKKNKQGGQNLEELLASSLSVEPEPNESDMFLNESSTLPSVPGSYLLPMPQNIEPMLANLVDEPFSHPEWLYELKWDGVRAICYIQNGKARFVSRNDKDMSFRYPEIADIANFINAETAILDGEIVALNDDGLPSFQLLQSRVGLKNEKEIERLARENPVVYYAFDLLYYNGFNLMPAALIHRKSMLQEIMVRGDKFRYSDHIVGEGKKFFREAEKAGAEGIIAKHQGSIYLQKRSSDWLKIKTLMRQEVVIAGYTEPRGARPMFGALVVGLYNDGELHYIGHVGGGFDYDSIKDLYDDMQRLKIGHSPFIKQPVTNERVQWIKPALVCEVKFSEWTADERLRQPIFLGLRDDKDPSECTFEQVRDTSLEVEKVEDKISFREKREERGNSEIRPAEKVLAEKNLSGNIKVDVEGHIVPLTNLEKVYWPDEGYTKGDLVRYYFNISEYILPHLADRPLILKRYPNGIKGKSFFQHDVNNAPEFLRTFPIEMEDGRIIDYAICDNRASLTYIANLGTIAQNPWTSRVGDLDHPDWIVFDLDPEKVDFDGVCEVALMVKDVLDRLSLDSYAKTSGASGIHIYVPIAPLYDYEQVAGFAELVSILVERENPDIATLERSLKKRKGGLVYIDHLQNARGKSIAAPYSVRAQAGTTVSAPLEWREVKRKPGIEDFTIENIRKRLTKKGDLFGNVLKNRQKLGTAIKKIEKILGDR
jgi:bifunctional non-homologous end joining protein LigD